MSYRLATSLIALSSAIAAPVAADVSAADVFSNQQALVSALGGTYSGTLGADGTVSPEINFILPEGAASLQVKVSEYTITDNGDGSVTMTYPSPMTISMSGGAPSEGSFDLEMILTHDGYTSIATGDAGDVTYDTNAQGLRLEFANLTVDDGQAIDMDVSGFLTMTEYTADTRIQEGNLITVTSTSTTGQSEADFSFGAENIVSNSTQSTMPLQTSILATLPVGGSDLMNLSAALRDGLSVVMTSAGEGSASTSETFLNGELMNRQVTSTGPQTANAAFDADGLRFDVEASDFSISMNDPLIFPGDLDFAIEAVTANYDVPVNASEDEQDFRIATSMSGLTMGDTIWNLFDPAAQLPRDPAEITFDITGVGTSGIDLLDFAAMAQMFGPPPVQVDEVTVENLKIAVVGAEATAAGAFTFDWTDFNTIPGVPRPEGTLTVNLNGANALMDTLVAMGFIAENDLMMPRMMLGMFANPVGDDMLESVIEVNEQGHVLANGQRLQ